VDATWFLYVEVMLLGTEVRLLYHGFLGSLLKTPFLATLGITSSTSGGRVVLTANESLFTPNFDTRGMGGLERISCSLDFKYEFRQANWRKSSAPNLAGRLFIAPTLAFPEMKYPE